MTARILSAWEIEGYETLIRDGEFFGDDVMGSLFFTLRTYAVVVEEVIKLRTWSVITAQDIEAALRSLPDGQEIEGEKERAVEAEAELRRQVQHRDNVYQAMRVVEREREAYKINAENARDLLRQERERAERLYAHLRNFPTDDRSYIIPHMGGCQSPHGGRCTCGMNEWRKTLDEIAPEWWRDDRASVPSAGQG